MATFDAESKRLVKALASGALVLGVLAGAGSSFLRAREREGFYGSLLRAPAAHARAFLVGAGVLNPPEVDVEGAVALVEPENSVQLEMGACPSQLESPPHSVRVRTQRIELSLSRGAPRWLHLALSPLLPEDV